MKQLLVIMVLICVMLFAVVLGARAFNEGVLIHCTRLWDSLYVCGVAR